MKTQPSKLLLALAVCFSMAAAHAEGDGKSSRSSKDTSGKSTNTVVTTGCTSTVQATACGPVQVTTCASSGSTTAAAISAAQKNKDAERHKDDGKDRGDGKDHSESDHGNNSKYSSRDNSKDDGDDNYGRPYGYRWEQSNSGGVKQRKVTVCHREGGARTTVDVDDDGRYHGHDNDPMDTIGACEDQDDNTGKHTDSKNKGRSVESIYKATTCGTVRAYAAPDASKHHADEEHGKNAGNRYANRDKTKDDASGYRWEHDKDGNTGTSGDRQRKVTVCHRVGGARVTLDVDDDGWYHGHDKHANDTLGACEDQDDSTHKYNKGALNGTNTVSLVKDAACSSTAATAATTGSAACTAAGGVTSVLGGLGCGGAGVSCAPLATGTRPMRGGLRNVR